MKTAIESAEAAAILGRLAADKLRESMTDTELSNHFRRLAARSSRLSRLPRSRRLAIAQNASRAATAKRKINGNS
jgi:hypothetical protein